MVPELSLSSSAPLPCVAVPCIAMSLNELALSSDSPPAAPRLCASSLCYCLHSGGSIRGAYQVQHESRQPGQAGTAELHFDVEGSGLDQASSML